MSSFLFLFLGPLFYALIVAMVQRRWPRAAALLGFIGVISLTVVLFSFDLQQEGGPVQEFFSADGPDVLLADAWFFSGGLREILLIVYVLAALLFLLASRWPQGPNFVPGALSSLAPLTIALMINPLNFAAAALLPAAALLSAVIQDRQPDAAVPAWRFLLFSALALPAFLVAGWMLESQGLAFGNTAWRLLFLATILVMGSFPFHIWLRPAFSRARPLAVLFIVGPAHLAILTFVYRWLEQYPQLLGTTPLSSLLGWSGAATAVAAAVLSFGEDNPRRLLGSLVLADIGATMVCLSQGPAGIEQAWALTVLRTVGLLLGLGGLLWAGDSPDLGPQRTLARHPLAAVLFACGALSLVGLPFTPGFATRWAAISLGGGVSIWWGIAQLLAVGAGLSGLLRTLAPLSDRLTEHPRALLAHVPGPQRRLSVAVFVVLLVLALSLTLYPWPFLNLVSSLHVQF